MRFLWWYLLGTNAFILAGAWAVPVGAQNIHACPIRTISTIKQYVIGSPIGRRETALQRDSAAYGLSLYYIGTAHGKLGHFAAAANSAAKALEFIPERRMGLMFTRILSVAGSNFFFIGEEAKTQSYLSAALRHQDLLLENTPFTLTKI